MRKEVLSSGKRACDFFCGAVSVAPRSGLYAIVYVRVASPTVIWQKKTDCTHSLNGISAALNLYRYLLNFVR